MADMIRAAVYTGAHKPFELREFPMPEPRDDDVVVKMSRTNICGSDIHIWSGHAGLASMGVRHGIILGHEMVGRVAAKGPRVKRDATGSRLNEGDRVVFNYYVGCGTCRACLRGDMHMCVMALATVVRSCDKAPHLYGGFSEYYYVNRRQMIFKVPDAVPDASVAGANCALSQVIHGFDRAGLKLGDNVVIQGAGGLGLYACAVAREMGAGTIVVIDDFAERLEMAKRFGADAVIDRTAEPDRKQRVRRVLGLCGNWGADVVVEVAGAPAAIPEGLRMVGRGGCYLEMGCINPRHTCKLDPSILTGANISIHGVSLYPAQVLKRAIDFLAATADRYPYEALVSHEFALDDISAAFAMLGPDGADRGSITRGAVVFGGK